jgi:hypothetical protein
VADFEAKYGNFARIHRKKDYIREQCLPFPAAVMFSVAAQIKE